MKITNHGHWVTYKPEALPEGAPPNAIFCKRESDGADWYEYLKQFKDDTVLLTLLPATDGEHLVQAVRYDARHVFPQNSLLLEIHDYKGDDPFKEFNGRLYDGRTITDRRPPPPRNLMQEIDDLRARIERLEKRTSE